MQIPLNFNETNEKINIETNIVKKPYKQEYIDIEKGQVYTRSNIVEFMLTSIKLNNCNDLDSIRILEPSCGKGEFVYAIVYRLIYTPKCKPNINQLLNVIVAVELVESSIEIAKLRVSKLLYQAGYSSNGINQLLTNWFYQADFLLKDIPKKFTHILGNPPYVRIEKIPKPLLMQYRSQFSTMTHRADLYIPFFEKSLSLLADNGTLSFICTDRWTKNIYGKSLRKFISQNYTLELFVDLYEEKPFDKAVMTYPAITQIAKKKGNTTIVMNNLSLMQQSSQVTLIKNIVNGSNPWLFGQFEKIELINKLEKEYPLLETVGCKVHIGIATGANNIFIIDGANNIEATRLVPVITASELRKGAINWKGRYLVNTYDRKGVISLKHYPKLENYLNSHKEQLSKRYIARKNKSNWFKTIDRIYIERLKQEKLLIPDISNNPVVIYDKGTYQPNNSIYYIFSSEWNLQALRVILLSDITKLFLSNYSTKIANGYLRFQAQHLRKLRIPIWSSINNDLQQRIIDAGTSNDIANFTQLAAEIYGLNKYEQRLLEK